MPQVVEMVHPRGLSFQMQRKLFLMRSVQKKKFTEIQPHLRNLEGGVPSLQTCINYYNAFSVGAGRVHSGYSKCGRKKWIFTKEVEDWIVHKLQCLRHKCVCTSTTLQHALARERNIKVSASGIRKVLQKRGYKWSLRAKKRVFDKKQRSARMAYARRVLRMSKPETDELISTDGVIVIMPPSDAIDRYNYCRFGDTHMWKKPSETLNPKLDGHDEYGKQANIARCVPLWGACSVGGFGIFTFHKRKKISQDEWLKVQRSGALKKVVQYLNPDNKRGPWTLLCDNEGFLEAKAVRQEYIKQKIKRVHVPPHSPDLNPVEKVWAHLRKHLRAMDLKDAIKKTTPLGKTAYRERLRRVLKSSKFQKLSRNIALSLRKSCRLVIQANGHSIKG